MNTATATGTRFIATCKKCKATRSYIANRKADRYGMDTRWSNCSCGRPGHAKAVAGTITDTPCDERCSTASGIKCSCSCGGENHGADFGGLR